MPETLSPVVAVLGPFRGGTSCVAGTLHHLGVSMGTDFRPPKPANPKGFFESESLGAICRASFREPWLQERQPPAWRIGRLKQWLVNRSAESGGQLIGAKHPTLCMMIPEIVEAWPDVRFVSVQRSVDDCIQSILRLGWGWGKAAPPRVIRAMIARRDIALMAFNRPVLRVHYADLLSHTNAIALLLAGFCDVTPTNAQLRAVSDFIDPKLHRHQVETKGAPRG